MGLAINICVASNKRLAILFVFFLLLFVLCCAAQSFLSTLSLLGAGFLTAHRWGVQEIAGALETNLETGLSQENYQDHIDRYGPNIVSSPSTPYCFRVLKHFFGGFSFLLWIGALLALLAFVIQAQVYAEVPMENFFLMLVLFVIVVSSGCAGHFIEYRNAQFVESFRSLYPREATVIREKVAKRVTAAELVDGDLVEVHAGEMVPADIRIVESYGVKVDNAALTGDNTPELRSSEIDNVNNPLQATNLLLFSTHVVEGWCRGLVVGTGDRSLMAQIANLAVNDEDFDGTSVVKRHLDGFMFILGVISVSVALLVFLITFIGMYYYWLYAVIFFIGVSLASVPLALTIVVAICTLVVCDKLSQRQCRVRTQSALSTLGSISVLCADKTGTLTENKLIVTKVICDKSQISPTAIRAEELGAPDSSVFPLFRAAVLCNNATMTDDRIMENQMHAAENAGVMIGDAIDCALHEFASPFLERAGFGKSFDMATLLTTSEDNQTRTILLMKGAPEHVLMKCSHYLVNGKRLELNRDPRSPTNDITQILDTTNELATNGHRIIAVAQRLDPVFGPKEEPADQLIFPGHALPEEPNDMTFIGLIALYDPIRSGVEMAVQRCRMAQIKVIMITGDHQTSAAAVAREIKILTKPLRQELAAQRRIREFEVPNRDVDACLVTGDMLTDLGQIDNILRMHKEIVFARITPHQKLYIVQVLQRQGHIVAVTGDGVNDAAALQRADVGIAVGVGCSHVCKEAADIIMEQDFCSIVDAVELGRLVFENLKKAICFIMASNIPQICSFMLFVLIDIPLPISATVILLIDLVTDLICSIGLAYEGPERLSRRQVQSYMYKAEDPDIVVPAHGEDEDHQTALLKPPSDIRKDRVINQRLLAVAYGQTGIIELIAGLQIWFMVMACHGFWANRLVGLRRDWDAPGINDVEDSYSQQWSYWQRKELEMTAQSAFFLTIVVLQCLNLLATRTRISSILVDPAHWVKSNVWCFMCAGIALIVAIILIYVPGINHFFNLRPVFEAWIIIPLIVWCMIFVLWDEVRRGVCRMHAEKKYLVPVLRNVSAWAHDTFAY